MDTLTLLVFSRENMNSKQDKEEAREGKAECSGERRVVPGEMSQLWASGGVATAGAGVASGWVEV